MLAHEKQFLNQIDHKDDEVKRILEQVDKFKQIQNGTSQQLLVKCSNAHYRAIAHVYAKSLGLFSHRSKPSAEVRAVCRHGTFIPCWNYHGNYYHNYQGRCQKCVKEPSVLNEYDCFTHKFYTHIDGVVIARNEAELTHLKTKRHDKWLKHCAAIHKRNWESLVGQEQEIADMIRTSGVGRGVSTEIVKRMKLQSSIPTAKQHVQPRTTWMTCD